MSAIHEGGVAVKDGHHPFIPMSPEEYLVVREELDRILASVFFQNSKRYPAFLKYVVEQALRGNNDLKERTLGVEVFGRAADYDSNADSVVRVTAGEVRKRLAQFYHHLEEPAGCEIELRTGSYVPEFYRSQIVAPEIRNEYQDQPVEVERRSTPSLPSNRIFRSSRLALYGCVAAVVILSVSFYAWHLRSERSDVLKQFWGGVLDSPGTAVVCMGDVETFQAQYPNIYSASRTVESNTSAGSHRHLTTRMDDVLIMVKMASVLEKYGKPFRVTSSMDTNLADLRGGPVVLIGAHNNRWTLRLTKDLRFYTQLDESGGHIFDRQRPQQTTWSRRMDGAQVGEDYGLLARYNDPTTGRPLIVIAGLGGNGNFALAELISSAASLKDLLKDAPADWAEKNLEAVVKVQVIDDKTGPPQVVAIRYW